MAPDWPNTRTKNGYLISQSEQAKFKLASSLSKSLKEQEVRVRELERLLEQSTSEKKVYVVSLLSTKMLTNSKTALDQVETVRKASEINSLQLQQSIQKAAEESSYNQQQLLVMKRKESEAQLHIAKLQSEIASLHQELSHVRCGFTSIVIHSVCQLTRPILCITRKAIFDTPAQVTQENKQLRDDLSHAKRTRTEAQITSDSVDTVRSSQQLDSITDRVVSQAEVDVEQSSSVDEILFMDDNDECNKSLTYEYQIPVVSMSPFDGRCGSRGGVPFSTVRSVRTTACVSPYIEAEATNLKGKSQSRKRKLGVSHSRKHDRKKYLCCSFPARLRNVLTL